MNMSFSKIIRIIIPIFIILLFSLQTIQKYSKIIIKEKENKSNDIIKFEIFGKHLILNNDMINYYYLTNTLVNIKPLEFTISSFLKYFLQCRSDPQELNCYIFCYLIFFDLLSLFMIYKFIKGFICYGFIKIILRIYKIFLDLKLYSSLKEKDGTSNLNGLLSNEMAYNVIFLFDIFYWIIKYNEYKRKKAKFGKIQHSFEKMEKSEESDNIEYKDLPKKNSEDEDSNNNEIKNNYNNQGESKM